MDNVIVLGQAIRPELFYSYLMALIMCVIVSVAYIMDEIKLKRIKPKRTHIYTIQINNKVA